MRKGFSAELSQITNQFQEKHKTKLLKFSFFIYFLSLLESYFQIAVMSNMQ